MFSPSHSHPIPPLWVVVEYPLERPESHWLSVLHMGMHVFPCHSQFIPPSPSPTVPTSQFSMSVKKTQILNAQLRENICMGTPMEAPPK